MKIKNERDPKVMLASFDLEQVIYLPKLLRKELYYSRQLSLYNFTVYDIKDGESWCYIWHEGIAKRGSNEIASCVHDFLQKVDEKGYEKVYFFPVTAAVDKIEILSYQPC